MADAAQDEAFTERYVELFVLAERVARRLLDNSQEAEDVAAETMVRALGSWRRVHTYSAPWVTRVAVNLATDQLRRRRRQPSAEGDRASADPTDRLAVSQALRKLPPRQRQAVVLRHMAGFSTAMTAELMGVSPESVKTHLQRGAAALRTELGPNAKEVVDVA